MVASCETVECLRQIGAQPGNSTSSSQGTTAAAAASAAAAPGIEEVLSATPVLLGIQPFGHIMSTPKFVTTHNLSGTPYTAAGAPTGSGTTAITPAVNTSSAALGASAEAAAAAAAPGSILQPTYDFSPFCFSEALSDIDLTAGGRTFPAHRLVLCAQSPRLAQLIHEQVTTGSMKEHPDAECRWTLHLPDTYADILALMLQVRLSWPPVLHAVHNKPGTCKQSGSCTWNNHRSLISCRGMCWRPAMMRPKCSE